MTPSMRKGALAIAAVTLAVQNGIVMAFAVLYLPLVAEFSASRAEVGKDAGGRLFVPRRPGSIRARGLSTRSACCSA